MKKNKTASTALVPFNPSGQGKAGLPQLAARLPARSSPRQPVSPEPEFWAHFGDEAMPRRRWRRDPPRLTAGTADESPGASRPSQDVHHPLQPAVEQALNYLLTPQLKRFLRYAAIGVAILVLADLLSSSGSGSACGVSIIQPAYPMAATRG